MPGSENLMDALVGALLGTAVGDALGLPYEGLSPRRARRVFGELGRFQLLPGRGMVSDDTEHSCMVLQSLIHSGDDVEAFARQLARRIRTWFLLVPPGIGLATVRASLKLCLGVSPERSGVFSAGNGPAMRAPVLGAAIEDLESLWQFVRASTRLTHTDPKAEQGALAVALAARMSSTRSPIDPQQYLARLQLLLDHASEPAHEFLGLVRRVVASSTSGESAVSFARALCGEAGVSGYMFHTVPVVLQIWLTSPFDYRAAVLNAIRCGGDTDTTAAIIGGIVGAGVGKEGIPAEWRRGMSDWPRTVRWMEELAECAGAGRTDQTPRRAPGLPVVAQWARNLVFLAIVLLHGFRRLLPPY